ncbi:MAG TPA: hypothetical protein VLZ11_01870 [Flavobacterium sp.]|nr:hypothetical protein [Flavobacterium sp.]
MKVLAHFICFIFLVFTSILTAQHQTSKAVISLDVKARTLIIDQEIKYTNNSDKPLGLLILNDWNNAFASRNSALSKRFSDEFVRSYYYAHESELAKTTVFSITDENGAAMAYHRSPEQVDLIEVILRKPLAPRQTTSLKISYQVKLPNDKFTGYGYNAHQKIEIKDWLLFPARLEDNNFLRYSNENLNDAANAHMNVAISLVTSEPMMITSNLGVIKTAENQFELMGSNKRCVHLVAEPETSFRSFKNDILEVDTNLFDSNIDEFSTAIIINKVVNFVNKKTGATNQEKIIVSEADYKRNPFYGLNQLPSFIRPFPDSFMYELKFLKAYAESYTKSNLNIDLRKDNWLSSAIEMYIITQYLKEHYPTMKMVGNISKMGILKGYFGTEMNFEDQFYYLYLMMARRNLDQPTGNPKNKLIKFNEQISSKYKAGLDFKYLDDFLGTDILPTSIQAFFQESKDNQVSEKDFKRILESKSEKVLAQYNQENLDWFFDQVIHSRKLIDYKISKVKKQKDSLRITLKNKGQATVPVSLYAFRQDSLLLKKWVFTTSKDTTITIANSHFDKLVLNQEGNIPEYDMKDNSKSLKGILSMNKPLKLTFFKDFENPHKNQLFYLPEFRYNYYDGITPGLRLSNKSLLKKPFLFDLSPMYSFNTKSMVGSAYVGYENLIREGGLYSVNYGLLANYYHYAPDAGYSRFIPSILFRIREPSFRENNQQTIMLRYVNVDREQSQYALNLNNEKYSIFNLRYHTSRNEITSSFSLLNDIQISDLFGKVSSQVEFRRLYENNRQFSLRFFGGIFTHRSTTSDFFSFGTHRVSDYLFDYNYYGRSEDTGFFAQQYVTADGGFKSKLTPYANQWILSTNASLSIWKWIEAYTDLGMIKNKYRNTEYLYDSGIRLNLVTDYFEVYFPVHSNLGFELNAPDYAQRIRFVITLDPNTFVRLFTRRWF